MLLQGSSILLDHGNGKGAAYIRGALM